MSDNNKLFEKSTFNPDKPNIMDNLMLMSGGQLKMQSIIPRGNSHFSFFRSLQCPHCVNIAKEVTEIENLFKKYEVDISFDHVFAGDKNSGSEYLYKIFAVSAVPTLIYHPSNNISETAVVFEPGENITEMKEKLLEFINLHERDKDLSKLLGKIAGELGIKKKKSELISDD